jgi:outer membrane translocation and assembly module TamA
MAAPRPRSRACPPSGAACSGAFGAFGVLLAVASGLAGCAAKLPGSATVLDDVRIEGTHELVEGDVARAMESRPTSAPLGVRLWWVDYGVYDREELARDLVRIERYYRTRGFYAARVKAGRVVPVEDRHVRVEIVVEEGARVVVDALRFEGLELLAPAVRAAVTDAWTLTAGDPLDEQLYQDGAPAAERALTDAGYAHAKVMVAIDLDSSVRHATVRVRVQPGPLCTLGAISFRGLAHLAEPDLRALAALGSGEPYSTRRLRDARTALRALDVLEDAQVEPDLGDPRATAIPIVITVREAAVRRLELVPGARLDAGRDEARLRATWHSRNFFGGLRELSAGATPTIALADGLGDERHVRVGLAADVELRQPGVLERRTTLVTGIGAAVVPDPANDFRSQRLAFALGLARRFGTHARAELSYRRSIDAPNAYGDASLPDNARPAGARAAQVGDLELTLRLDRLDVEEPAEGRVVPWRRDPTRAPRHGFDLALSLQVAPTARTFLAGDTADVRSRAELRVFGTLAKGVVLAFRFMAGFVLPLDYDAHAPTRRAPDAADPSSYADDTSREVPYARAFFAGGLGSNRGYPSRWIGLRDCAPSSPANGGAPGAREVGEACSLVVGGASVWEGSLELRFDVAERLAAALFVDAGDVSRGLFDLRLGYPHLSVGPAVRWGTPFGPLEVALGVRVPGAQRLGGALDPRETPRETALFGRAPIALHVRLVEAF